MLINEDSNFDSLKLLLVFHFKYFLIKCSQRITYVDYDDDDDDDINTIFGHFVFFPVRPHRFGVKKVTRNIEKKAHGLNKFKKKKNRDMQQQQCWLNITLIQGLSVLAATGIVYLRLRDLRFPAHFRHLLSQSPVWFSISGLHHRTQSTHFYKTLVVQLPLTCSHLTKKKKKKKKKKKLISACSFTCTYFEWLYRL